MKPLGLWLLFIVSLIAVSGCLNPIEDPPLSYILRFDPNGGTGDLESPYVLAPAFALARVGNGVTVPDRGTLVNGTLFFHGWNTRAAGSGIVFAAGSVLNMPAHDVTLYAQWSPDAPTYTHSVTFDSQGADVPADPALLEVSSPDTTIVSLPSEPARAGFLFNGWWTEPAGGGSEFTAATTVSGDLTVYAHWVADGVFAGGSGTEAEPYLVATAEHLDSVRNYLGAYFLLTADIDLAVAPWNQDEGWLPIGNNATPFSGTFDGAGRVISGLFIDRNVLGAGLFGYLAGATVEDLRLEGVSIVNPGNNSGALAGAQQLPASSISRVSASGTVSSAGVNTGGLIGYARGLVLSESYTTTAVTGDRSVGGLIGSMDDGEIRDSYATGPVSGTGTDGRVGGLIGNKVAGQVLQSYAAGSVSSFAGPSGGLLGVNTGTVSESYYDRYTSGQDDTDRGNPATTAEMVQAASFAGWDFGIIWAVQEGSSYPYLQWQGAMDVPYPDTAFFLRDPGPAGGPVFFDKGLYSNGWRYMEATAADLSWVLWSSPLVEVGATGAAVGDGPANTVAIVAALGAQTDMAALLANDHSEGGFDDWFLPSVGELEQMDINLDPVADFGFDSAPYWSSTEASLALAAIWNFLSGDAADVQKDAATYRIRPARRF